MTTTTDTTVARARQYLGGAHADPDHVLGWRRTLRREQQPALARALSRKLAEQFIGGTRLSVKQVDALWKACKTDEAFSHARRVLNRRRSGKNLLDHPDSGDVSADELREQAALMTSKDPDLAASVRHDWALRILEPDLERSSAETIGIAGGIWKRRWEFDGRISSLERSLQYYLAPVSRGRAKGATDAEHDRDGRGVTAKEGYPAINAACVCDLLARMTEDEATQATYRARATELRRRICRAIAGDSYWVLATLAEARFGLGEIDAAVALLQAAATRQPDPWERDSTARQMARIGVAREVPLADTTRVVSAIVGSGPGAAACVQSVLIGKVGLALSGGGFRAALYHLGVLARLAESDLLRHVEALSTVSGGSMVGAAYYLRLKNLLSSNAAPDGSAYVQLVRELIEDFRQGTNANLRNLLFTDLQVCRAVLAGKDEVYAERLAAAVFRTLYSRTVASDPHMSELAITPVDAEADFHPRYHNMQRTAKVPALLLSATALNTGHSWQFTTTSMGESPFAIVAGADPLPRLRRSYYRNPQGNEVRGVTLSAAVTASASVPGLFAPLALENLYEGYSVRLVDGGVYDNQGALGLLQEDCNVLIVSDACGQLGLDKAPGGGHISPLLRSVGIFQERMRQASYDNLRAAREHGRLSGLAYVHLKQDLEAAAVNWINCEDPSEPDDQLPDSSIRSTTTTGYGVWKRHQTLLADIRTDLDVFSDIESAALMASGYLAMDTEMRRLVRDVPALGSSHEEASWFFSPIIPYLRGQHAVLERHLEAGSKQVMRAMGLSRKVRTWAIVAAVVALGIIGGVVWLYRDRTISVGWLALALLGAAAPFVLGKWSWMWALTDPLGALRARANRWLTAVGVWALARFLVPRMTRHYLELGRIERLADMPTRGTR